MALDHAFIPYILFCSRVYNIHECGTVMLYNLASGMREVIVPFIKNILNGMEEIYTRWNVNYIVKKHAKKIQEYVIS